MTYAGVGGRGGVDYLYTYLAFRVASEKVFTLIPLATGMAQAAMG